MIFLFFNIHKVPQEVLKTSGLAFGFQHFPGGLENVNEWKIIFDPSNTQLKAHFMCSKYFYVLY